MKDVCCALNFKKALINGTLSDIMILYSVASPPLTLPTYPFSHCHVHCGLCCATSSWGHIEYMIADACYTRLLQSYINRLTTLFSKCRIKVNTDKTQAIVFTWWTPRDITQLRLNNRKMDYTGKTKYLGIILDKKFSYLDHIKYTRGKTTRKLIQLYPILAFNAYTLKWKTTIYTSLIRSILIYASSAWEYALTTHMRLPRQSKTK